MNNLTCSNHSIEKFTQLLSMNSIDCIVDVRSSPYSKYVMQFNKENIEKHLKGLNIQYVFLGVELGARQTSPEMLTNGQVDFNKVSKSELFNKGIQRLIDGIMKGYKIALMCAEKEPIECHRFILVTRALTARGVEVSHILADGTIKTTKKLEDELMAEELGAGYMQPDLFSGMDSVKEEPLESAYKKRGLAIAYKTEEVDK